MNIFKQIESSLLQKKGPCCAYVNNNENLDTLRMLTENLGPIGGKVPAYVHDKSDISEIVVYDNGIIEVRHISAKKGVIFPLHTHHEKEIICIARGRLEMSIHGVVTEYSESDTIFVPRNNGHEVTILENIEAIVIFIQNKDGGSNGRH